MRHRLAMLLLSLPLVGCQDLFGADRHDVVGDRIVAVVVDPPGAPAGALVTARAALVVDGQPWSDEAVALSWQWTDDPASMVAGDGVSGPNLRVPDGDSRLGLVATFPSGTVARAVIDVSRVETASPPALHGLGAAGQVIARDDVVELVADVDGDPMMRWMTVGGRGTFVEKTRTTTDFIASDVVFDGEVEESRTDVAEGLLTVIGLALFDDGNGVRAEDGWIGTPPPGAWLSDGRFVTMDDAAVGTWEATVVADDDAPWGIGLTGAVAATGEAAALDLDGLLFGEVRRSELVGQTATVTVDGVTP